MSNHRQPRLIRLKCRRIFEDSCGLARDVGAQKFFKQVQGHVDAKRYAAAGGRYFVCPICFDSRKLDKGDLIPGAELGGTVPMWQWIGDENATTFSY